VRVRGNASGTFGSGVDLSCSRGRQVLTAGRSMQAPGINAPRKKRDGGGGNTLEREHYRAMETAKGNHLKR